MTILSAGDWFLVVVGLYIGGSFCYFLEGKTAMFLVLACYAVANFGLILASNKV